MLLRNRVQLIFALLALLTVADVALDRYLVAQRDDHRSDVTDRWEPAREATAGLLFGLVDQETGERGYVITGNDEFLDPYHEGGQQTDDAIAELQRLVGDDAVIRPQLQRTADRVAAWRQLGAMVEIEAKQAGRDRAAVDLVATGTSKRLFDEARVEIDDLRLTIVERLQAEEEAVRAVEGRISTLRLWSAIAALAIVIGGGELLRRWLSHPLRRVTAAARTVASGHLEHEIPTPGPPELAGLGRDVEAMRRRILAEVDDAARARTSLAKRGMIVLTLREELAPEHRVDPPAGLVVATRFRPAEAVVAGDWYEVRRRGDQSLVFVDADVSGHGPEAGIFALKTKQLVRIALQQGFGPAAAWTWVAEHLGDTDDQFLTGVIGVIDTTAGSLTYASAGHPPLLLHHVRQGVEFLSPTGPLVGAFAASWDDGRADFGPGCSLIAYSDGLLDVQDGDGAWAELAQLQAALQWERSPTVERLADLCLDFHDRYDGRDHHDDVTVVAIAAVDG